MTKLIFTPTKLEIRYDGDIGSNIYDFNQVVTAAEGRYEGAALREFQEWHRRRGLKSLFGAGSEIEISNGFYIVKNPSISDTIATIPEAMIPSNELTRYVDLRPISREARAIENLWPRLLFLSGRTGLETEVLPISDKHTITNLRLHFKPDRYEIELKI